MSDERTYSYSYDNRHRLTHYRQMQPGSVLTESRYLYDPLGRRISKRVWKSQEERDLNGDGYLWLNPTPEVAWYGWDGDRLTTTQTDDTRIQTVYPPGSFTPLIRTETATEALAKTHHRSLAEKLQQDAGMAFVPELVALLDNLERELNAGRVSELSRQWLAQCGLTPEQMKSQMAPAYTPARKIHLYHCDHRGLPLALIDGKGRIAWRAEFDEWGNMLRENNPDNLQQLIRLPGQQYDEESGLHYNRHRYYDPGQGRYITQGPTGLAGGLNPYVYALNPVSWTDPLGLEQFLFSNADEAGLFAIKMCNADSIENNLEYGGLICKKDENYFYTGPLKGNLAGVNPYKAACPDDSKRVGVYHTHGYFSDTEGNKVLKGNDAYDSLHFSPQDKSSADFFAKGEKEYSSYLGTPESTYFKYNPKTQKVSEMK
ncbi:RHS repeat protein [Salmonella enterica subsp. enterica]|nr:RHS repeat protein [Salmonella enterica subsp. enterica]